jgi:hypothetical protein
MIIGKLGFDKLSQKLLALLKTSAGISDQLISIINGLAVSRISGGCPSRKNQG